MIKKLLWFYTYRINCYQYKLLGLGIALYSFVMEMASVEIQYLRRGIIDHKYSYNINLIIQINNFTHKVQNTLPK